MPKTESMENNINIEHESEKEKKKFELNEIDAKIAEILSIIKNCEVYAAKKIKDDYLLDSLNVIKKGITDLSVLLFDREEIKVAEDNNLMDNLGQLETLLAVLELLKRRTENGRKAMSENEKKLFENFSLRIGEAEKYVKSIIKDGGLLEKELATHKEKHNGDK
ncbi:MAG: hypothetical protein V1667_02380 [bacterium]